MKYFKRRKVNSYHVINHMISELLKRRIDNIRRDEYELIFDEILSSGKYEFTERQISKGTPLIRLTLPFAFITMIIMLIFLPVNYIIFGRWNYDITWIRNWFSRLGI